MIKNRVKGDKSSILSNSLSADVSPNPTIKSGSTLIDTHAVQQKIVKNSIKHIVPKGSWYPNQKLKSTYSSKFSGSPEPKKISGMSFRLKNSICLDNRSSNLIKPVQMDCDLIDQDDLKDMRDLTTQKQVSLSAQIHKSGKFNHLDGNVPFG